MAKNKKQYIVLCEDKLQEVFIRTYLETRGVPKRKIAVEPVVGGLGSGEQYVRENYKELVRLHRSKAPYLSVTLVVMIDADHATVREHLRRLNDTLDTKRQSDERIVIFVPKRHIETWIRFAAGETVDEGLDYHERRRNESKCKPHVKRLANEICHIDLPSNAPPSLKSACDEIARILP